MRILGYIILFLLLCTPLVFAAGDTTINGNLNLPHLSSGGLLVTGSPSTALLLTNGQLAIGLTGSAPVAANLTAGTGITITNGPGSITISSGGGGPTPTPTSSGPTQTPTATPTPIVLNGVVTGPYNSNVFNSANTAGNTMNNAFTLNNQGNNYNSYYGAPIALTLDYDATFGGSIFVLQGMPNYLVANLPSCPYTGLNLPVVIDATDANCTSGGIPVGGGLTGYACQVNCVSGTWKFTGVTVAFPNAYFAVLADSGGIDTYYPGLANYSYGSGSFPNGFLQSESNFGATGYTDVTGTLGASFPFGSLPLQCTIAAGAQQCPAASSNSGTEVVVTDATAGSCVLNDVLVGGGSVYCFGLSNGTNYIALSGGSSSGPTSTPTPTPGPTPTPTQTPGPTPGPFSGIGSVNILSGILTLLANNGPTFASATPTVTPTPTPASGSCASNSWVSSWVYPFSFSCSTPTQSPTPTLTPTPTATPTQTPASFTCAHDSFVGAGQYPFSFTCSTMTATQTPTESPTPTLTPTPTQTPTQTPGPFSGIGSVNILSGVLTLQANLGPLFASQTPTVTPTPTPAPFTCPANSFVASGNYPFTFTCATMTATQTPTPTSTSTPTPSPTPVTGYISSSVCSSNSGPPTTATCNIPTGWASGDLFVASVCSYAKVATYPTGFCPSGWIQSSVESYNSIFVDIQYCIYQASSSEPSTYTFGLGTGSGTGVSPYNLGQPMVIIRDYRGQATIVPNVSSIYPATPGTNTLSSTALIPGVTTIGASYWFDSVFTACGDNWGDPINISDLSTQLSNTQQGIGTGAFTYLSGDKIQSTPGVVASEFVGYPTPQATPTPLQNYVGGVLSFEFGVALPTPIPLHFTASTETTAQTINTSDYFPISGLISAINATEANVEQTVSGAYTIKNLQCWCNTSPGGANGVKQIFTVRHNGTALNITCSMQNATSCTDSAHTVVTVAGDRYDYAVMPSPGATPTTTPVPSQCSCSVGP